MDDYRRLGLQLKELRQKRGLKQSELAELLFVSRRCIGYWESGHRKPDIKTLKKIADILHFDFNDLVDPIENTSDSLKIIIIEEEKATLDIYVDIVKQAIKEIPVIGFTDSMEAYDYAKEHNICIAFLDIELLASNGLILAQKLTSLYPEVNIIFITEHSEYALDALNLFCSGYVIKPLTKEKLKNQLEHLRFPIKPYIN
ncbi:Helix-turn-helix domain-containing protein [Butyrivibrio proteoclasticus]|uniref:Stage 0 sporulation protein A homolog n=1 Tax=Butyrivibrio proteoclasticus TaxID=43305 RepID=A0A1I5S3T7_9FIRM|nr:response regulator [Butyrivibrio proteoclasticus]SFP65364.1 Helix-turn-helix domain-containing protein [Butyrivibrio proteoclasticus]